MHATPCSVAFRKENKMKWQFPNSLALGTFFLTSATGMRSFLQAIVFLIIVRILDIREYGVYSAVAALAIALGSLVGLGVHFIMVREVARNRQLFPQAWGWTRATLVISAPFFYAIYLLFSWLVFPVHIPWGVIILLGLSELICTPIILSVIHAYQSQERMEKAAYILFIPVIPRLISALICGVLTLIFPQGVYLLLWSTLYFLSSVIATFYIFHFALIDFGSGVSSDWKTIREKIITGLPFALSSFALRLYTDIDKTLLARFATLEETGAYSAANRLVDLALLPIISLLMTATPDFFRAGATGISQALAYSRRLLPLPALFSLLISCVIFWGADVLIWLLGSGYQRTILSLRWLAWLPCISLPRLFLQAVFSGSDLQHYSGGVLILGAGLNIILNLWLIPIWGWRGAVIVTYATECAISCALFLIVALRRPKIADVQ